MKVADLSGAISVESSLSSRSVFKSEIHKLKNHSGQRIVAANIWKLLDKSEIVLSHKNCDRMQDPYSFRCIPQVHGISRENYKCAKKIVENEDDELISFSKSMFVKFIFIKFKRRKIYIFCLSGILVFSALTTLRAIRDVGEDVNFSSFAGYDSSESKFSNQDLSAVILLQDYYLPSHTLFISMEYDIVDPLEVVKSNVANSLVLLDYPFLTNTILDRGLGIENERGVGWGFHFFVEGYNAMGILGVFYNALLWNLGMVLWIRLTQSNNMRLNQVMLAMAALVIVLITRGQFAAFIKFYWLVLLLSLIHI